MKMKVAKYARARIVNNKSVPCHPARYMLQRTS